MVRLKGLEPTRIAAREPKGDVTLVTNRVYTPKSGDFISKMNSQTVLF